MTNKKAFTLTELLVAVGIIGAIAAVSIPSLMNNINKQIYTTRLKGITQTFKQTIDAQLLAKRTSTLENTDFSSPSQLFNNHFDTVKYCTYDDSSCWPDMNYRTLNGGTTEIIRQSTAKLRNGTTILYNEISSDQIVDGDTVYQEVYVDLNGADKPNIVGRDLFSFYISKRGKIHASFTLKSYEDQDGSNGGEAIKALHIYRNNCLSGQPQDCYGSIVNNGWRMSY